MRKIRSGTPDTKGLKIKFSILQLTFWCSWCAFTSFAALYFRHEGLSASQTGFALSLSALCGIPGQAFWGYLSDRLRTVKKVFVSANIIIGAAIAMFLFFKTPVAIMIFMGVLGFTQIPQPAVLDAWILRKMPGRETEYGYIRLWASFGFAVSALLFGRLINLFGFPAMFVSASAFLLSTVAVSLTVPETRDDFPDKTPQKNLKEEYIEIIRNKSFLFFLLVGFVIGLAARTTHVLLPLIIENVHGNAADLGTSLFLMGLAEIPVLMISKRLSKRFKALSLISISIVLYLFQFALLYFAESARTVFFATVMQGFAFGIYLPSVRLFVNQNAPDNLQTSAQTLADMIVSSLAGVIGSAAGGIIIHNSGIRPVVVLCLIIAASAGAILIFGKLKFRFFKH